MEQTLIDLYNPKNAKNLTAEQLAAMATFSDDDIKALANAYPNTATGNAYLVLGNKKLSQQIGARSTFANLYNVRVRNQQKQFYALSFTSIFKQTQAKKTTADLADITKEEIEGLPGIKKLAKKTAVQNVKPTPKEKTKAKEQTAKQVSNDTKKVSSIPDPNADDNFDDLTDEAAKAAK